MKKLLFILLAASTMTYSCTKVEAEDPIELPKVQPTQNITNTVIVFDSANATNILGSWKCYGTGGYRKFDDTAMEEYNNQSYRRGAYTIDSTRTIIWVTTRYKNKKTDPWKAYPSPSTVKLKCCTIENDTLYSNGVNMGGFPYHQKEGWR